MRDSIVESINSTITDLNKSGLVDDISMKNIQRLNGYERDILDSVENDEWQSKGNIQQRLV
ncbi:MAG: hypothetical protein GQ582_09565, partial [Methyloprofundus sp.]|nr:hypothetical protein [Methyloprofundus sp.]